MVTRFAPSPTGLLHSGHAYAAWVAWRMAQESGGVMLLRYEDIDFSRVREEYYHSIVEDLRWLGLSWPEPAWKQNDRGVAYDAAIIKLREVELVYPCFCTRREIAAEWERMGRAPQMGDGTEGDRYPGTCRSLSGVQREVRMQRGDAYAWRIDWDKAVKYCGNIGFFDHRFGSISVCGKALGDVVISRKDIGASYHLAVVIDDAAQGVTLVTRGEDLLASTHVHRVLQAVLALPTPEYLHHPLVMDVDGRRLAKRHQATALRSMREQGVQPMDLLKTPETWLQEFLSIARK